MSDTWGVNGDSEGEPADLDTEQQVAIFLQSNGIKLDLNNVEACHPLPRRRKGGRSALILRFMNWKLQTVLLKQQIILKGTNMFLKKHLKTLSSPENYGS
ncbi:hypothetical protein AMECASPLE_022902 [Ameca splendens]|uniref:Uncharacterized protein n=1 Tax=Ameca splendens TaxID=208324 RepID=A0ABV0XT18_9TELE